MTKLPWLDRAAGGECVVTFPSSTTFVSGRFIVATDGWTQEDLPLAAGSMVLASADGYVRLMSPEGEGFDFEVPEDAVPSDVVAKALRTFGERVEANGIEHAAGVPPLVSPTLHSLEHDDTTRAITDCLRPMEAAVRNPHQRLRTGTVVEPIGRVRRLDSRAPGYLASHSEDWAIKTPSGIRPSRVLSRVVEADGDIYENRVLKAALAQSTGHLRRQLRSAQDVEAFAEVLVATFERISKPEYSWRSGNALYEILGEAYNSLGDLPESVRSIQRDVNAALRRVRFMLGSPGMRPVGRMPDRHVHMTNLLRDDSRYRAAAGVLGRLTVPMAAQAVRAAEARQMMEDLVTFCQAQVVRALSAAGIEVVETSGNDCLAFTDGWVLRRDGWNRLELTTPDRRQLKLVPIPHALDHDRSDSIIDQLQAASNPSHVTVYLYLPRSAQPDPRANPAAYALPHETGSCVGFIPLSPLDAESSLRVGRLIFWLSGSAEMTRYGQPLNLPPSTWRLILDHKPDFIDYDEQARIGYLWSVPSNRVLEALLQTAQPPKIDWARTRDTFASVDEIRKQVDSSIATLRRIGTCPICGARGKVEPREQKTFWGACVDCGAEWGLRMCSAGHRIPIVIPKSARNSTDRQPDWITRSAGSQSLALPCLQPGESTNFICPTCGDCGGASDTTDCERCALRLSEYGRIVGVGNS